jgi:hypothetical protein
LHAQCDFVAIGATIASRQEEQEDPGSRDRAQDEESHKYHGEPNGIRHFIAPLPPTYRLQALFHIGPKLHSCNVPIDSLNHHFGVSCNGSVIKGPRAQVNAAAVHFEDNPSGPIGFDRFFYSRHLTLKLVPWIILRVGGRHCERPHNSPGDECRSDGGNADHKYGARNSGESR